MNLHVLLRGLLLIASLIGLGYLLEITQFGASLNEAWIDSEVRGKGMSGEALFVAAGGLFTALGLPRQAVAFLGGYAFGFITGTALGLLAALFGCASAFYYARLLGRGFVAARFPHKIKKLDDFLRGNPFSMALLIRLLPVGSNAATNLVAGVSSVRGLPFFAGSALGYIPQTAVFALIGSGIQLDPVLRIGAGIALFLASGILGVWLYRKYRRGKTSDEEIERELKQANGD